MQLLRLKRRSSFECNCIAPESLTLFIPSDSLFSFNLSSYHLDIVKIRTKWVGTERREQMMKGKLRSRESE